MMHSSSSLPPPNYVLLNGHRSPPRSQGSNVPRNGSGCPSRRGCCFKCICCCYCLLFLLVFILAGLLFYAYTFYQPVLPRYRLTNFDVKTFDDAMPDFSLYTELHVTVEAENPNDSIGITYGNDSHVIVSFKDTPICEGKLPVFHQGHKNVTAIQVVLKGNSTFGSGLYQALEYSKRNARIPLLVALRAPITIIIKEKFPLRQFLVSVDCAVVVDNFKAGQRPSILSTRYTYGLGV